MLVDFEIGESVKAPGAQGTAGRRGGRGEGYEYRLVYDEIQVDEAEVKDNDKQNKRRVGCGEGRKTRFDRLGQR